MVNLDKCIEQLYNGQHLSEQEVKTICDMAKEHFSKVSNVINVSAPISVVGDIHGQFYDLLGM